MVDIRRLTDEDKGKLYFLIDMIENNLENKSVWMPVSDTSREHFFDTNWTEFFGAFHNETLVGAVGLFYNENEYKENAEALGLHNESIVELGRLMVEPRYRRMGIAKKLVNAAYRNVNKSKCNCLLATVHPDNKSSRCALESIGLELKGTIIKTDGYPRLVLAKSL